MKYIKVAGIAWGLIYFAVGVLKSFTLGSIDFWSGVTFFFATFLLPLPIALVAVWFPRIAGKTLLFCSAISVITAVIAIIPSPPTSNLADMGIFFAFIAMYNVPHLAFGMAYIMAGRASKNVDSGDDGSSIEAA